MRFSGETLGNIFSFSLEREREKQVVFATGFNDRSIDQFFLQGFFCSSTAEKTTEFC